MTPLVVDTFMINNEMDMLELRLVELGEVVDFFVAVEAEVDHQDHPKPFHLSESDRFSAWKDQLVVVKAKGLPTMEEDPDPWAREHTQREHTRFGLDDLGVTGNDVIMHGDIDEIPTPLVARNMRPQGFVSCTQRGHFWSLRWLYPEPWFGTVAGRARDIASFGAMRDMRNIVRKIPSAGWHLSWLGGAEVAMQKVGSFCHPEVRDRIVKGLAADQFLRHGFHVDGKQMTRCEIDDSFPRYVREGRCPESWLQ